MLSSPPLRQFGPTPVKFLDSLRNYHQRRILAKEEEVVTVRSEFWLWLASQIIDYATAIALCYNQTIYNIPNHVTKNYASILHFAGSLTIINIVSVGLLYLREALHFRLLGARMASCKGSCGEFPMSSWQYIWQTTTVSTLSTFILSLMGFFHFPNQIEWTWNSWGTIYLQFYAMLILRDWFSLAPFHTLMHTKAFYSWHKTHHQVRSNAQGMHAFHIDVTDLLLENVGAPPLLFILQWILPQHSVGLHSFAAALLTAHDGALHSINPYSAMYFNPLLDHLMKGNVCHQLHHALNKDYLLFVPYAHLWSTEKRRYDIEKYNKCFKTNFNLR